MWCNKQFAPMLREMSKTVPLGRFGTEAEISAGIVFLLSPAAAFISGSTLRMDGARPQARLGWPLKSADPGAATPEAMKPFDGFHRATSPKIFSK